MATSKRDILRETISDLKPEPLDASPGALADDLRALRQRLNLSQEGFADRYGLSVANIRNWEQLNKNTQPDSSARLVIEMIKVDPVGVAEIVKTAMEAKEDKLKKVG
jgi:putative transcriptional regulator